MNDDYENKPLFIMLPKTSAYVKSYDNENKWMNFLIKDDDFLMIFEKDSNSIKKRTLLW